MRPVPSLPVTVALLLSLSACSQASGSELDPGAWSGAGADAGEPGPLAGPTPACFFDGDVTAALRATTTLEADGATRLELSWDATAPAGAAWLPPSRVSRARLPFGVGCGENGAPLEGVEASASVTGDRAVSVRLPPGLGGRCAEVLSVPIVLTPAAYAGKCVNRLSRDGLPYWILGVELKAAPRGGALRVQRVSGTSFTEG
ncbi:MAG: hypothetical protein U1F43_17155 [Myxococcota bacterium]